MKKIVTVFVMVLLVLQMTPLATSAKTTPIKVFVEGKQLKPDIDPYTSGGRTLIEVRSFFESIGFTLSYNSKTREVTGKRGNHVLKLTLNSKKASINGKIIALDVAPTTKNGRTVVPLRFVGEAVGMNVSWNQAKREVVAKGIHFKEEDLERYIRGELNMVDHEKPILGIDLEKFTSLDFYVGYPADFPYAVFFSTVDDLAYFSNLKSLHIIGDFTNIRGLAKLSKLESLSISNEGTLTSLEGLENKPNLKVLSINSKGTISSFKPLENLTALEQLHLWVNGNGDNSFLQKLSKLKSLYIQNVTDRDVSYLNKLSNLTSLSIANAPLTTIDQLQLPKLTALNIRNTNLKTLRLTGTYAQLQSLMLDANQLEAIHVESDLPKLRELTINNNQLKQLPDLSKMPNVTSLWAGENQIESIEGLQYVTQLKTLWLSDNQIEDISVLSNIETLDTVFLRNNHIQTLPSFAKLQELYELDLGYNQLTSIEPLQDAFMLMNVSLDHNQIKSLEPLADLGWLRKLAAHGNPIAALPNFNNHNVDYYYFELTISAIDVLDYDQLRAYVENNRVTLYYDEQYEEQAKQFEQSLQQQGNFNLYATPEPKN